MQQRCNTHNLPVVTSFLVSLEVRSLSLLLADFLSLEFSLFLLSRDFVRLYFSFRCEATFMSPRIVFFIFVSVSCIRSGHWIHQIHAGGQTSYKIRQKFRRLKIPGNGNDDCSLALSFSIMASSLAQTPAEGTRLFSVYSFMQNKASLSTNSSLGVQEKVKTQQKKKQNKHRR